ncbi:hypothetical protein SAMN04515647_1615 [Cohaesibacter sp. ES.047]|uniref:hypothetical protein n=1 Tax=Cohaesibacter sp. ES.047 TaxID=1798205 RepID=UPI000BB7D41B|nr:hypothetical protein [Cohaesibacter sp. ES.047]SNY91393.1 hypothetical protein SAMN04515647_1615 [Cohaesibacter sp. ES.047]
MSEWTKPTGYNDVLASIVARIETSGIFMQGAKIEMAPGTLTEGWIAKASIPNSGAAFVALGKLLSVKRRSDGMQEHLLNLGIFAAAPYGGRLDQAKSLNDLVFNLTRLIEDNRFELVQAGKPSGFSGRNLFSLSLMKKGSALWALEWRQSFMMFDQDGRQLGAPVSSQLGRETEWPTSSELANVSP